MCLVKIVYKHLTIKSYRLGEHCTIETSVLIARLEPHSYNNLTITTYFELIYDICRITSEVIQTDRDSRQRVLAGEI